MWQDIEEQSGMMGQFSMNGKRVHKDDVIIDDVSKGVVLKDTNGGYWRLEVDTDGTVTTEQINPGIKD
jgi:hypothetical protein